LAAQGYLDYWPFKAPDTEGVQRIAPFPYVQQALYASMLTVRPCHGPQSAQLVTLDSRQTVHARSKDAIGGYHAG
jgi:hypothetical protein